MSVFDLGWQAKLRRLLKQRTVRLRNGAILGDGIDGYVHVDWLGLRPDGIWLIDVLEGDGRLLAGDNLAEWTLTGRRRFVFPNPARMLQIKWAAVRRLSGDQVTNALLVLAPDLEIPQLRPTLAVEFRAVASKLSPISGGDAISPKLAEVWSRLEAEIDRSDRWDLGER